MLVLPSILHSQINQILRGFDMLYTWLGMVIFDICVFSLTIWKAFEMRRTCKWIPGGIMTVIMRDGAMYFGIITIINTINMVLWGVGPGFFKNSLSDLSTVVSSVMMSHLMLNLRARNSSEFWLIQTEIVDA
ncbi:hypothetical protein GYMLUDRAFT_830102 [Collybiopsis luxurians FD-317 M1]|uniref:Uncharacterized protein n=1 Tax=Collybiopsis luxurians FD-317 M1 TaxID=944289 RepID=A0A0D0CL45_9AGAR|nr:hypothetical protein GYMLUDRAFT_830102 [Collybiopsis luxurians FD-317 M1]